MEISLAFIFAAVFLSGVFVMMWGIHNQSGIAVILGSLLTLIGGVVLRTSFWAVRLAASKPLPWPHTFCPSRAYNVGL
jgi:hypothetical protein